MDIYFFAKLTENKVDIQVCTMFSLKKVNSMPCVRFLITEVNNMLLTGKHQNVASQKFQTHLITLFNWLHT